MSMSPEQKQAVIRSIIAALEGVASAANPVLGAGLAALVGAGTELNVLIHQAAADDPAAWAAIVADGQGSIEAWKASLAHSVQ